MRRGSLVRRALGLLPREELGRVKRAFERRGLMMERPDLSVGEDCVLSETTLGRHVELANGVALVRAELGDRTYVGARSSITHATVGKFCSIAAEVRVGLGSHPAGRNVTTHPLFYLHRPERGFDFAERDYIADDFAHTQIGNDVWIGLRACIRDGVRIGDGAIIGTGAVVTRDVPPYAVVAGVPGRVLRRRFDDETIELLLDFKWWDRDEAWLRANFRAFHDVEDLKRLLRAQP